MVDYLGHIWSKTILRGPAAVQVAWGHSWGTTWSSKNARLWLFTIGRFTVWVNDKQNLGLVSFAPESRLPFAQISLIGSWYKPILRLLLTFTFRHKSRTTSSSFLAAAFLGSIFCSWNKSRAAESYWFSACKSKTEQMLFRTSLLSGLLWKI